MSNISISCKNYINEMCYDKKVSIIAQYLDVDFIKLSLELFLLEKVYNNSY